MHQFAGCCFQSEASIVGLENTKCSMCCHPALPSVVTHSNHGTLGYNDDGTLGYTGIAR